MKKIKILVFDTETTGLPPFQIDEKDYPPEKINKNGDWESYDDYNNSINQLRSKKRAEEKALEKDSSLWENYKETWPYIVQLSYIMFDTATNETIVVDNYIEIPTKFTTPKYLATAHPITKTAIESGLAAKSRINISDAIDKFMTYFNTADVVTGHNVKFDINMLLAECTRKNKDDVFNKLIEPKSAAKNYCTAYKSKDVVNIYYQYANRYKTPPTVFKTPKLNQAYFRMFGYAPNEAALHNALIDVVACLRVFYRLWFQGIQFTEHDNNVPVFGEGEPDIYIKLKDDPNNEIIKIINSFTPAEIDPVGVGSSSLIICPPINNDQIESLMTGKSIEQIISESKANSRRSRYNEITGINKSIQKGDSRNKKNSKRKSKRNKSKRNKSKRNKSKRNKSKRNKSKKIHNR
jgi:DNA polymerase III epsilon subunit-like protein